MNPEILNANPAIIHAMEPAKLKLLIAELANNLQHVAGILAVVSQQISMEPISTLQPQRVSAAAHYLPLKKTVKRIWDWNVSKARKSTCTRTTIRPRERMRLDLAGRLAISLLRLARLTGQMAGHRPNFCHRDRKNERFGSGLADSSV